MFLRDIQVKIGMVGNYAIDRIFIHYKLLLLVKRNAHKNAIYSVIAAKYNTCYWQMTYSMLLLCRSKMGPPLALLALLI